MTISELKASLFEACLVGDLDKVKIIIENCNVDINSQDKNGNTPLMFAASNRQREIVTYLVNHGADTSARRNGDGKNILDLSGMDEGILALVLEEI